jgi:hypothetical protein
LVSRAWSGSPHAWHTTWVTSWCPQRCWRTSGGPSPPARYRSPQAIRVVMTGYRSRPAPVRWYSKRAGCLPDRPPRRLPQRPDPGHRVLRRRRRRLSRAAGQPASSRGWPAHQDHRPPSPAEPARPASSQPAGGPALRLNGPEPGSVRPAPVGLSPTRVSARLFVYLTCALSAFRSNRGVP